MLTRWRSKKKEIKEQKAWILKKVKYFRIVFTIGR